MDDEKLSLISLNTIVELTPRKIISLINYFGSAKNIFVADVKELKSFDISDKGIQAVKSVSDFEVANKELVLAEKNSVKIVTYLDEYYPHQLIIFDSIGNNNLNFFDIVSIEYFSYL